MGIFDLHHIIIKTLVGSVGMGIGVFEQKALTQLVGIDEILYLLAYLLAVVG